MPIVPALVVGVMSLLLLVVNIDNQQAFTTLTSVAIIMFYLAYLGVTGSMLVRRFRGEWPLADHGPYFCLGRWGFAINTIAVVYGAFVAFDIAWPRADVYGTAWYFRFGAYEFIGASVIIGLIYYYGVQRKKGDQVLAEHRAEDEFLLAQPHLSEAAP